MASTALRILGLTLVAFGGTAALIACALPAWRVSLGVGGIGTNSSEPAWEGLWMECGATGPGGGGRSCATYEPSAALPQDLRAARALTLAALAISLLGLCLGAAGCPCARGPARGASLGLAAGLASLPAGLLMLLTGSWSAHAARQQLLDPLVALDLKREPGPATYLALAAGALLVLGGALLCCSWPRAAERFQGTLHHASSTARKPRRSRP
ncbi:claudin-9-like [Heterodontus francisci]|uniref:claudin-9-like n=1 Tax=Heterodontus francisci TaxID=7792 RepID=UPI00355AED99